MGDAQPDKAYTVDKYLVGGIIEKIVSDQYGNCYIKDADGNSIYVYGLYSADGSTRYDALETKPQAGDYVVVLGTIGKYNGTVQIKSGWIITHTTTTSIKDANDVANGTGDNKYTDNKYLVTGVIESIVSDKYGNVYIQDSEGNKLYVYGLYDATGANGYNALEYKPQVGDTITVLGVLGNYKKNDSTDPATPQMKNAWIVDLAKAEAEATGLPANLDFTNAANKASGDDFMKENYKDWTITGKLGQTYGGYLGFGRSGDEQSSIKSAALKTDKAFNVKVVLKGNGGNSPTTSTLTFSLVDAAGNVVATADAVTPAEGVDTTYEINFTLAEGKTWADVSNLLVSFNKDNGNIGLKSLEFVA